MENTKSFADLGLSAPILKAIEKKGYTVPSPIQAGVIPVFLSSQKDIIGQAQTGTGKTAAFGLPLLEKIDKRKHNVQAIILTPTRELAIQVADEIKSFSDAKDVDIVLLYGGQNIGMELRALKRVPQIVVGTPGRVQDHLRKKSLQIDKVDYFILDEADEMLNVGFREEIDSILESAPEKKRVLLFSATMPKAIKDIVHNYMGEHELIAVKREELTNKNIVQKCFKVKESSKFDALCRVIDTEDHFYGIIFCRTKMGVDELASKLVGRGYLAEGIHGDIEQKGREKMLSRFKGKKINILVATDVAARGIDVNNLTHVVNYDLPDNPETYTHRIGRTGRAGNTGVAISFVSRRDSRTMVHIERIIKQKVEIHKLPGAKEIIDSKKQRLLEDVVKNIGAGDLSDFRDISEKLLKLGDPTDVIAGVLKRVYADTYSESYYSDIREESSFGNSDGKTRLFVAKGRNDGFDVIGIKKIIEKEAGIDMRPVRDVSLFNDFSFITINSDDAEIILSVFKKLNKIKPLVVKAKEKDGGGGRPRFSKTIDSDKGGYRGGVSTMGRRSRGPRRDGERKSFRIDRGDLGRRG